MRVASWRRPRALARHISMQESCATVAYRTSLRLPTGTLMSATRCDQVRPSVFAQTTMSDGCCKQFANERVERSFAKSCRRDQRPARPSTSRTTSRARRCRRSRPVTPITMARRGSRPPILPCLCTPNLPAAWTCGQLHIDLVLRSDAVPLSSTLAGAHAPAVAMPRLCASVARQSGAREQQT